MGTIEAALTCGGCANLILSMDSVLPHFIDALHGVVDSKDQEKVALVTSVLVAFHRRHGQ